MGGDPAHPDRPRRGGELSPMLAVPAPARSDGRAAAVDCDDASDEEWHEALDRTLADIFGLDDRGRGHLEDRR
ncbi:hypothetical protein GCM10010440_76640 [Kitasatospora cinereorecta]